MPPRNPEQFICSPFLRDGTCTGSDLEGCESHDDAPVYLSREEREGMEHARAGAQRQLAGLLSRKGRATGGNLRLIGAVVTAPDSTLVRVSGYAR
jgi:hypothetical protein